MSQRQHLTPETRCWLCGFLESRGDLLGSLGSLWVADQWLDMYNETINQDHPVSVLDNGNFYRPLHKTLENIVGSSGNLTSIAFSQMKLPLDLVACICHLPKLDHLDLRMCTITKKAQRVLLLDARGVLSSTVRNLDIMAAGERSPWYAILFCPRLAVSPLMPLGARYTHLQSLWGKCQIFATLKYLFLSNLVPHEISTFAEWIQEASQGATPPLTHLKITVERNMFDADIIRLLQAADTAPLEVLSIDGASQADLYLLTG